MSIPPVPDSAPAVLRFEDSVRTGLESGLVDRVTFMSREEAAAALRAHRGNQARMDALGLALIAHAERVGVAELDACTNMAAWLRTQLQVAPGEARRQVKLARQLEIFEPTQVALSLGEISMAAAQVVATTVAGLPRETEPAERALAETHLLGLARSHDTNDLRGLAKYLDEVINPDGADARLAKALARAEAKAARETWCHLWFDQQTQSCAGRFQVDLLTGRKLQRMLESLMNPARPDPIPLTDEDGRQVSADERRGQALVELVDRIPKDNLPKTGGCDPVVIVTMSLETLTGAEKCAVLDTGDRISPSLARRLAAQHGVIPAVLGTHSEVLDLGRKARLASRKQRIALSVQQRGVCGHDQCDTPAAWAEAHHLHQWHTGGRTDLHNLVLLCKRHHRMADHPDYRTQRISPGKIRINRRT